jgi:dUTP pyrophosphatase
MIRWILSRIAGFLIPSLLASFFKPPNGETKKDNSLDVQFKILDQKLGQDISLPKFQTEGSAAIDLRTNIENSVILKPNESHLFTTGFSIHIKNPSYAALIMPRSGLGHKHGIVLGNSIGLIDSDYQGEIMISLWNRSLESFKVEPGDRIAQMMFLEIASPTFKIVSEFSESERGDKGFGSSGKN